MAKPSLDQIAKQSLDSIAQQTTQPKPSLDMLAKSTPQKTFGQNISDFGEGLSSFAGNIEKPIAESGLLDKPMAAIGRGVGNVARALGFNVASKEEIEQRLIDNPFSKEASGSQVGGDPSSRTAKTTSAVMNTAALVAGIPSIIKGSIKVAGMKGLEKAVQSGKVTEKVIKKGGGSKILNLIKESDTIGNKRAALSRGGIKTQSAISKRRNGTKDVVKPSQRTLDAVGTIKTEIKKASKDPQLLYNQVKDKIEEIAKPMSDGLKNVGLKGTNTNTTTTIDKLKDLAMEMSDISKNTGKKITTLATSLKNATNADEIRAGLKNIDKNIPDNIKKGINLSGKDELIRNAWRGAREAGNDLLDDIASKTTDINIKQGLKKLSNLYHAKGQIQQNIGTVTKAVKGVKQKLITGGKNLLKAGLAGGAAALGWKAFGGGGSGGGGTYTQE